MNIYYRFVLNFNALWLKSKTGRLIQFYMQAAAKFG